MRNQASGGRSAAPHSQARWIVTVFLVTILISGLFSLLSSLIFETCALLVAFLVLLLIVAVGIVFDMVGVAVTAADETPFHSMASRRVPAAGEAIRLLRNAARVGSVCNDVIGDICGVISGSAAAVISARVLLLSKSGSEIFITLLLSAVVSGMTVGGKACGKSLAMNSSTAVVRTAAKVLCFFRTLPQRLEKKSAKK